MRFTPPAPDVQNFTLERWSRVTFVGAPKQPGRAVFDFVGTFDCVVDESTGRTTVTHAYEFNFKGPFKSAERFLSDWLQAEVEAEVARLGEFVDA